MDMIETHIPIEREADIVAARQEGRRLASEIGFAGADLTIIATAISELSRNIVKYAGRGELRFWAEDGSRGPGLAFQARDEGPGIPDIGLAMQDGYTSGHGLGLGLPGTRRLMDEFAIESLPGKGTIITVKKWTRART
jgi:serine/threonine-protein kinase RsbT